MARVNAIANDLRALGVESGGVLLAHIAFRAVRPVEGGPLSLIAALTQALGPAGTLVMPSMGANEDEVFDPTDHEPYADLGATARLFWRQPGVLRSNHIHAFAARGPKAAAIVADPLPEPPHGPASPVGRVCDLDGQILMLGIDHTANTSLHLAEIIGGARYRSPSPCTVLRDGHPVRIVLGENNHCCERFVLADDWLRAEGVQREGKVGNAHARLMRSRDLVRLASAQVARNETIFLHAPADGCEECDEARASLPA